MAAAAASIRCRSSAVSASSSLSVTPTYGTWHALSSHRFSCLTSSSGQHVPIRPQQGLLFIGQPGGTTTSDDQDADMMRTGSILVTMSIAREKFFVHNPAVHSMYNIAMSRSLHKHVGSM